VAWHACTHTDLTWGWLTLLHMCCLAHAHCQVYRGVVPPGEFGAMVDELVAGPCIAVEVRVCE
jgi:hypothetical protein